MTTCVKKIEKQEDFNILYDTFRAMTVFDHIMSPCHPLKKYRRSVMQKLRENGDEEFSERLFIAEDRKH